MIVLTRELVELKYKILTQKINKVDNVLKILSVSMDCRSEIESISVIQQQYQRMYNEIIRTGEYQKYPEVEDAVISQLAKIEFKLDQKVYDTAKTHENVLDGIFASIKESTHCKEFYGLNEEIGKINSIKELLKLYSPYINRQARNNAKEKIASCKFNLLLRRELEQSICENDSYNHLKGNSYFKELLEQIVTEIQKVYDSSRTPEIEQKVYEAEANENSQLKKLLEEVITEMEKKHEPVKIHEIVLDGIFEKIRGSSNYREAHGVDDELEKIALLKELIKQYEPYINEDERKKVRKRISTFKFELLFRKQLEQIVYENGGQSSSFLRYDNEEERKIFEDLLDEAINKIGKEDSLLKSLYLSYMVDIIENEHRTERCKIDGEEPLSSKVMGDNIFINHIVYKILEKEIEENANKYIGLLKAPIFNPHLCNIANDPYSETIPYVEKRNGNPGYIIYPPGKDNYLRRSKVNLSLLISVLKDVISDENTTIIECDNIYNRFGFKCRPITINEGQELIRKIFNKVRDDVKQQPKPVDTSKTNGQMCRIFLTGYNYVFAPKPRWFFTTAQMRKFWQNSGVIRNMEDYQVNHAKGVNEGQEIISKILDAVRSEPIDRVKEMISLIGKQDLTLEEQKTILGVRNWINSQINDYDYEWERPLDGWTFRETPIPISKEYGGSRHSGMTWEVRYYNVPDVKPLWESYKKDFEELGVRVKKLKPERFSSTSRPWFTIFINLDDIANLPIDYEKIHILTEEEAKRLEGAEKEDGR